MAPIATSNAIARGSTRLAVRASMARVVVAHHRSIVRRTALATIVYRIILVANVKNATAPPTNNAAMATMVRAVATAGKDGRGPIANRAPTTTVGVKYPFGWCLLWRWRW